MDKNLYSTIPLSRVVKDCTLDAGESLSIVEEKYTRWAVRVLRKLNRQVIKANKKRTALNVSLSTKTAALPPDTREVSFIGFRDDQDRKVPIFIDPEIYGEYEKTPESCCAKCGQPKAACEALEVTVTTVPIVPIPDCACYYYAGYYYYSASNEYGSGYYACGPIGGGIGTIDYTETITKRLLPNGDYIEDKTFPIYDPQTCTVRMTSSRKLVQTFELNDCGCIKPTKANAEKMCGCNSDAYYLYFYDYFSPKAETCEVGVKVFMEQGIMKFSGNIDFTKVFIEYYGDLPKKNGEYVIPEMALETVIAGVHVMRIQHKKGVTESAIERAERKFKSERKDMMKLLPNRLTLYDILDAATQVPIP